MAISLGDSVVQVDVALGGLANSLGLLGAVAERWMESVLVGHVLYGADLLTRIHIGEGTSNNSTSVRDFAVGAINVS